jgi:hypothetical protein
MILLFDGLGRRLFGRLGRPRLVSETWATAAYEREGIPAEGLVGLGLFPAPAPVDGEPQAFHLEAGVSGQGFGRLRPVRLSPVYGAHVEVVPPKMMKT